MKTIAIVLTDSSYRDARRDRARALRESRGVEATPFWGIDAARLGIHAGRYELDETQVLSSKVVGTWLSHRALWAACLLDSHEDEFLILEDDAEFPADWRTHFAIGLRHLPPNWDVWNVGPCCVGDKKLTHVSGPIYTVSPGPMCMHAYLVHRRALRPLIETVDAAGLKSPIDIALMLRAMAGLNYYIHYPRIVHQFELPDLAP